MTQHEPWFGRRSYVEAVEMVDLDALAEDLNAEEPETSARIVADPVADHVVQMSRDLIILGQAIRDDLRRGDHLGPVARARRVVMLDRLGRAQGLIGDLLYNPRDPDGWLADADRVDVEALPELYRIGSES